MSKINSATSNSNPGYEEALEELQAIIKAIEQDEVSIDMLADKIKRASFLVKLCQEKLRSTQEAVDKVMKSLGNQDDLSEASEIE